MQTVTPSAVALRLFRLHIERQGNMIVDDSNLAAYEELAAAGLMKAGHSFLHGRDGIYGLTREGFDRKAELLNSSGLSAPESTTIPLMVLPPIRPPGLKAHHLPSPA
jgi:hypothetical protein